MFVNTVFGLFFSIIFNFYSVSTVHWIYSRSTGQSRIVNNISETNNETDWFQKLTEDNRTSTTENEVLFWTKPDSKDTVQADLEVVTESDKSDKLDKEPENVNNMLQSLEDSTELETNDATPASISSTELMQDDPKPEKNQSTDVTHNDAPDVSNVMDEKIILQRNNCHLEIGIHESHDLKIEIRFGKLQNKTSGKCCITLNGEENTSLGVLISNVYLQQNNSQRERLQVITTDHGSDFVLKEYYSRTNYEPLLLTESHRVYILLYYNVDSLPRNEEESHFNLEVFSYHKYGNYIHHESSYSDSHFPYQNGVQNLPVQEPYFGPYYYY